MTLGEMSASQHAGHAAASQTPDFAAFGPADAAFALASTDAPPRLLHVSPAMLRLLAAADMAGAGARLFGAGEAGSRRLAARAGAGAPPSLERLRVFEGARARLLTLACHTLSAREGEAIFVISAPGVDVARPAPAKTTPPAPAPAIPPTPDRPRRFVWSLDADGRVAALGPELEAAGADVEGLIGRSLAEWAARPGVDPHGALAAALASRATFAGVAAFWPRAGGEVAAPVTLGATPARDRGGEFAGWRGYGVIQPERVPLPALARPETPVATPPEAPEVDAPPETPAPAAPVENAPAPKVVALRPRDPDEGGAMAAAPREAVAPQALIELTPGERRAFRDLARALRASAPEAGEARTAPPAPGGAEDEFPEEETGADPASPAALMSGDDAADEDAGQSVAGPVAQAADIAGPASEEDDGQSPDGPRFDVPAPRETATAPAEAPSDEAGDAGGEDGEDAPPALPPPARVPMSLADIPAPAPAPAAPSAAGAEPPDEFGARGRALIDRLPIGVLVTRGGATIYANRTMLDLLGYADVDAFHDHGGPEGMFVAQPDMPPEGGALSLRARDGELIRVDGRMQTIEREDGPATLMSFRRLADPDLAPRTRALEKELRERQAEARELHAILDTATDGVVVLDAEGRILSLNRAAEALFGGERSDVVGEPIASLLAPESRRAALDYLEGIKAAGVASLLNDGREVIGRERNGGAIPLFMTLGPLNEAGADARFCAVLRDLTSWKNAERETNEARRQAERASALKSDFLAKISHEIRTPLNAIIGFAEVIMDERFGPVGNERYKDYLKDIHASGAHVMSLVNDLLDLSKIEAGKLDLNFTAVDANQVINECVSLMQPQSLKERVILRVSLGPRLPKIVADERSLRQIVLNLLSNAVKFNQPGGQVIVSTALADSGHAAIRIRDTGVGMSEEEISLALEPFRQIATARPTAGTGLGLPLTRALVEANRAAFSIQSRNKEGTLVEVTFPPTRVLAE